MRRPSRLRESPHGDGNVTGGPAGLLVRRWLDEAGIDDPVLRHCYTICARNIADADKGVGRWWALKGMPAALRPHMAALVATAYAADTCADTGPMDRRRDRVDEYADATLTAIAAGWSADPVLHAVAHTHQSTKLPTSVCEGMFDAARRDCDFTEFATYDDLRWWMTRSTGGPVVVAMWLLTGPETTTALEPRIREFGELFQFGDNLCDLAEDLDDGRLYLPLEDLDRFRVRAEDLKARRWTPETADLIAFEVDRVVHRLAELLPVLAPYTPLPAAMVDWFERLMREVRAAGPALLHRAVRLRFPDLVDVWQPLWRAMIPC